jgi:DNA-binding NarL/FixJ family response regulator
MIRVLLSDDHNLFREGLIAIIEGENDLTVVGEAEDGMSLISKFEELKPDVVVSDISMPGKSGPDAVKIITRNNVGVKILFLSQFTGDDYIYSVLQSGGTGLISKKVLRNELINAIRTVAEGGKYFMGKSEDELKAIRKRFNLIKKRDQKDRAVDLTKKEEEILLLVGENLSSREIAEKLKISLRTVDTHRLNIISKLHLKSLPGLISFARDYSRKDSINV